MYKNVFLQRQVVLLENFITNIWVEEDIVPNKLKKLQQVMSIIKHWAVSNTLALMINFNRSYIYLTV